MVGIGNSAAYQVSGWPHITGSHITASVGYVKVTLPSVAKSVTVHNVDGSCIWDANRGFTVTGSTTLIVYFGPEPTGSHPVSQLIYNHGISIPVSGSKTFDVKCTQFYVAKRTAAEFGAFQAIAEMTNVPVEEMYKTAIQNNLTKSIRDGVLTGSGIDF